MSLLKSELKQLFTHEVGVRIDDALEAAKRDLNVLDGRQQAFLDGAKAVEALQTYVNKDVDEDKFDLKTAEHVKRYVTRAVTALQNLSQQAVGAKLTAQGKVLGFEHTITLLKGIMDAERAKAEAIRAAAATGAAVVEDDSAAATSAGGEGRPVGVRPLSIKEQRLAEEAAEEAAAQEPPQEQPSASNP
jgi:hypothetical protein